MQNRPEAADLMDAVAEMLIKEVLPLAQEHGGDALAYKALVSWNMLGIVARELRQGEGLLNEELANLAQLLGQAAPAGDSYMEKMSAARELNAKLAKKIATEKIGPENAEIWRHAKDALQKTLTVSNPRFSLE